MKEENELDKEGGDDMEWRDRIRIVCNVGREDSDMKCRKAMGNM